MDGGAAGGLPVGILLDPHDNPRFRDPRADPDPNDEPDDEEPPGHPFEPMAWRPDRCSYPHCMSPRQDHTEVKSQPGKVSGGSVRYDRRGPAKLGHAANQRYRSARKTYRTYRHPVRSAKRSFKKRAKKLLTTWFG